MDDDELFAELYPRLRRLASAVAPAGHDPDDLVQEALARTLSKVALTQLQEPGAYLGRAIMNLAANERRRLGRLRIALQRLASPSGSVQSEYSADVAMLVLLPPHVRAVLWLVDVEGHSFEQAAAFLGCSASAARARASRGRRRLRHLMEDE